MYMSKISIALYITEEKVISINKITRSFSMVLIGEINKSINQKTFFIQLSFLTLHSLKRVTGKCNRNISIFL